MNKLTAPALGARRAVWFGPLLVLLGGVSIGFAPIGLRYGLEDLGPQAIAFWRYVFAAPLLFLLAVGLQRRLPAKPNPYILVAGICFALDIGLWHWALTYTSVANATFIVNLGNICVGLTAWLFLKERPTLIWAAAVLLAIIGAAALSLGAPNPEGAPNPRALRGDLLAVAAAFFVSGYIVASKVARRTIGGLDAIFWLTVVEIATAACMVVFFREPFWPRDLSGFVVPLFLAVFVQIGGQGLIILGLGHTPTSIAGVLIVVQPVVAALLSWQLFGEILVPIQISGCLFILFGILLAQSGNRKSALKPSQEPVTKLTQSSETSQGNPMRIAFFLSAGLFMLSACALEAQFDVETVDPLQTRAAIPQQASDAYYRTGANAVAARLDSDFAPKAKNIILFVGDGMGISTITAARIYAGQKRGQDGESYALTMETLPHMALSRTYSHDYQVPDSASTATAMVSGVKTRSGVLGLTSEAARGNCAGQAGHETESLFVLAERQGLATGIISTARLTHATPASTYAKSADRNWEDDGSFGRAGAQGCADIATQLIDWPEGDGFEVAMGGGRRHFMTDETFDPEYEGNTGRRGDERDLVVAWTAKSEEHDVIYSGADFAAVDFNSDARVLGLFEPSHMQYEIDRPTDPGAEPSLAELTSAAITRLSRDEDGFVLMVEGGRIDHAHHATNAARALEDTDAFDQAIAAALAMTDPENTLIIVTADHSHTMTLAGYPRRNNPILGKATTVTGVELKGTDGKPYTTLGYANGVTGCQPDEAGKCERADLSDIDTARPDFQQQSLVPMASETHAGEDVAIFASGPGAELVRGVMDQQEIFHVMGYASGLVARDVEQGLSSAPATADAAGRFGGLVFEAWCFAKR